MATDPYKKYLDQDPFKPYRTKRSKLGATEAIEDDEENGRFLSAVGGFGRSAGSVLTSVPKQLGVHAEALEEFLTGEKADINDSVLYELGESIDTAVEAITPDVNPEYRDEWQQILSEGLGSAAGFMAGGLAGAGLKTGTLIAAGLGSASLGQESFEDAINNKADFDTAYKAAGFGNILGTSEAIPVHRLFKRLDDLSGGIVKRTLMSGLKGAGEEALQEGFQNIGQNLIASDLVGYDPDRGLFEDTTKSVAAGGGVGFIMNALMTIIAGRRARIKPDNSTETVDGADRPEIDKGPVERAAEQIVPQESTETDPETGIELSDTRLKAEYARLKQIETSIANSKDEKATERLEKRKEEIISDLQKDYLETKPDGSSKKNTVAQKEANNIIDRFTTPQEPKQSIAEKNAEKVTQAEDEIKEGLAKQIVETEAEKETQIEQIEQKAQAVAEEIVEPTEKAEQAIVTTEDAVKPIVGFKEDTEIPNMQDPLKNPEYFASWKNRQVRQVTMTPDEYIDAAVKGFGSTLESIVESRDPKVVKEYAEAMRNGDEFPALSLDYDKGFTQEGLHRALAAKEAGIESIPVFVASEFQHNYPQPLTQEETDAAVEQVLEQTEATERTNPAEEQVISAEIKVKSDEKLDKIANKPIEKYVSDTVTDIDSMDEAELVERWLDEADEATYEKAQELPFEVQVRRARKHFGSQKKLDTTTLEARRTADGDLTQGFQENDTVDFNDRYTPRQVAAPVVPIAQAFDSAGNIDYKSHSRGAELKQRVDQVNNFVTKQLHSLRRSVQDKVEFYVINSLSDAKALKADNLYRQGKVVGKAKNLSEVPAAYFRKAKDGKKPAIIINAYTFANEGAFTDIEPHITTTIMHELVGHYGFRELFSGVTESYDNFLITAAKKSPEIAKKAFDAGARWNNWYKKADAKDIIPIRMVSADGKYKTEWVSQELMTRYMDEYVAVLSEKLANPETLESFTKGQKSFIQRAVVLIRHLFRKIINNRAEYITDNDILLMAAESHTRLFKPAEGVKAPMKNGRFETEIRAEGVAKTLDENIALTPRERAESDVEDVDFANDLLGMNIDVAYTGDFRQDLSDNISALEKAFNKRIVFVSKKDARAIDLPFDGMVIPSMGDVIFVNIDAKTPIMTVVGHELVHSIRNTQPGLYNDLLAAVQEHFNPTIKQFEDYKEYVDKGRREAGLQDVDYDMVWEEYVADALGTSFTDHTFWNKLAKGNPNLFQKIATSIKNFLNDIIAKLTGTTLRGAQDMTELEAIRDKLADILSSTEFTDDLLASRPNTNNPMFNKDAPIYYSELTKSVEGLNIKATNAENWIKEINALAKKGIIKQEEVEWSGINEWLDDQKYSGKIPKSDVIDMLNYLKVHIDEVIYTDETVRATEAQKIIGSIDSWNKTTIQSGNGIIEEYSIKDDIKYSNKVNNVILHNPETGDTWIDVGDIELTYQNVMQAIDVLAKEVYTDIVGESTTKWNREINGHKLFTSGDNYKEIILTLPNSEGKYQHRAHWGTLLNPIGHIRISEQVLEDGTRVLLIDELQSDWHQEAKNIREEEVLRLAEKLRIKKAEARAQVDKDFGYITDEYRKKLENERLELKEKLDKSASALSDAKDRERGYILDLMDKYGYRGTRAQFLAEFYMSYESDKRLKEYEYTQLKTLRREVSLLRKVRENLLMTINDELDNKVSDAPFKKEEAWSLLLFKRALRYAAEKGLDGIIWHPGVVQADRYNLRRFASSIEFQKSSQEVDRINFRVVDYNGGVLLEKTTSQNPSEIRDIFGEEVMKKVIGSKEPGWNRVLVDDLAIGGEGMIRFYDTSLKKYINKYLKKWGVSVEKRGFKSGDSVGNKRLYFFKDDNGRIRGPYKTLQDADADLYSLISIDPKKYPLLTKEEDFMNTVALGQAYIELGDYSGGLNQIRLGWGMIGDMLATGSEELIKEAREFQDYVIDIEERTYSEYAPSDVWHVKITDKMKNFALGSQPMFTPHEDTNGDIDQAELDALSETFNRGKDISSIKATWAARQKGQGVIRMNAGSRFGAKMYQATKEHFPRLFSYLDPAGTMRAIDLKRDVGYLSLGEVDKYTKLASKASKMLEKLDARQSKAVMDWMRNTDIPLETLETEYGLNKIQTGALQSYKDAIIEFGERLVRLGLLDPKTFLKNKGKYLPGRYLAHIYANKGSGRKASPLNYLKARDPELSDQEKVLLGKIEDPSFSIPEAIALIGRDIALLEYTKTLQQLDNDLDLGWILGDNKITHLNGHTTSITQAETMVDNWQKMLDDYSKGPIKDRNSIFQMDNPDVEDIKANLEHTRQALAIQKDLLEAKIKDAAGIPQDEALPEILESDTLGGIYKKMPNDAGYGSLAGQYVRKELYSEFVESEFIGKDLFGAEKVFAPGGPADRVNQHWKMMKVPFNLPSWLRNGIGNGVLLDISTPTSSLKLAEMFRQELQESLIPAILGKENRSVYWQLAHDHGLFGTTFSSNELFMLQDAYSAREKMRLQQDLNTAKGWLKSGLLQFQLYYRIAGEKAAMGYGGLEGLFKTLALKDYLIRWTKQEEARIYKETGQKTTVNVSKLPDAQREAVLAEAVKHAHQAIFDYSEVPMWLKDFRRSAFGAPFLTYTYKAAPAVIRAFSKNPQKFAKYVALPYILSALAMSSWGDLEPEEVEEFEKNWVSWMKQKGSMYTWPWKDKNGRILVGNFGYYFPWAPWVDIGLKMGSKFDDTNSISDLIVNSFSAGKEFTNGIGLLGGPVPELMGLYKTGRDSFLGKEVASESLNSNQKLANIINYAYTLWMPPWLSNSGVSGRLMDHFGLSAFEAIGLPRVEPKTDSKGNLITTVGEDLLKAAGVSVYPSTLAEARSKAIKEHRYKINELKKAKAAARKLPKDKRVKEIAEYNRRIRALNKSFRDREATLQTKVTKHLMD